MKVYRLEDEWGEGVYTSGAFYSPFSDRHPAPWEDPVRGTLETTDRDWCGTMVCGFADRDQLCRWFEEHEVRELEAKGFPVREFDVDEADVIVLERQCLFVRSEAA